MRFAIGRGATSTLLLLFSALPGATSSASAIELDSFGLKGGGLVLINDFQFEGEALIDTDRRFGFVAGAFVEWKGSRRAQWHVITELLYQRKGYEGERQLPTDPARIAVEASADYLSVPILVKAGFSQSRLSIYGLFGPSLELLLDNDPDPILDDFRSWSIAGNIGLGFDYELSEPAHLLLELRFNNDFVDNFGGPDDSPLRSAVHRIFQVIGGLRF